MRPVDTMPKEGLALVAVPNVDGERLSCFICGHPQFDNKNAPATEFTVTLVSDTSTIGVGLHRLCMERTQRKQGDSRVVTRAELEELLLAEELWSKANTHHSRLTLYRRRIAARKAVGLE